MNKLVNGVLIPLTEEENEAARATQTNEAERWALNRQREYPTIQECIHAILDNELDELQAKRAAVKAKYPKS